MRSHKAWRSTGLAMALVAMSWTGAQALEFKYKFKAGDKLSYHDFACLAMESGPAEGDADRVQLRVDSRLRQTIKKVEGGSATIEVETLENQTETIPEDGKSTKKEDKNDPERIRIDERGTVLERKTLSKEAKKDPDPVDVFAILQQMFDKIRLPQGNVEPGAEWTENVELNLTPSLDKATLVKGSYTSRFVRLVTLKGQEAAEIATEFKISLKAPKPIETEGLKMTLDGQLLGKLAMFFSPSLGRSLVETGTVGIHTEMAISPAIKGKVEKIQLNRTIKLNTKTVLED